MLLPAKHGDDALCYRVNICTMESDNKVAVQVRVLWSGSWAIHCIAKGLLAKSPVEILPTSKIYMAMQVYMIHPETGPHSGEILHINYVVPNLGKCIPHF